MLRFLTNRTCSHTYILHIHITRNKNQCPNHPYRLLQSTLLTSILKSERTEIMAVNYVKEKKKKQTKHIERDEILKQIECICYAFASLFLCFRIKKFGICFLLFCFNETIAHRAINQKSIHSKAFWIVQCPFHLRVVVHFLELPYLHVN